MAFRLLEDHLRDVKQRIRPARHLDLPRQGFDAFVFGAQAEVDFRQWRRQWAALLRLTPAKFRSRAAEWPAAVAFGAGRTALGSGRTTAVALWAIAVPSRARGGIAPGRAWATTIAIAAPVRALGLALVFGVLGGGRLLRPSGQKEFVQV